MSQLTCLIFRSVFMLTEQLLKATNFGAEWILWLLIILFAVEIAIMIERSIFYFRYKLDVDNFNKDFRIKLFEGKIDDVKNQLKKSNSFESNAIMAGIEVMDKGSETAQEIIDSVKSANRIVLERNLTVLGTLGSNTPFIGLFGTVLGIIKAFKDLALASSGGDMMKDGQGAVMAGISEALIATGVGLLVAIPAVIAYNYFMRKVKVINANTDILTSTLIGYLKIDEKPLKEEIKKEEIKIEKLDKKDKK